ncbi:MAG: class I SAM-dependent methyltransferase [Solirubrobacterales bacterium]|nr:class I SAM-dependent methyltransferase [Solirubrobacterales bacterium]
MSVNEAARRGFGRGADAYERGRPEYPEEAVAWLIGELELGAGRTVADVGAGTGKLTRALLPSGAEVIAVEPVAAMRAVLEREVPAARAVNGTAEALPIDEESVHAVVAASAFHWFDGPRALAEFHRVLAPGGRLGLLWNRRERHQPLHRAIDAIIEPYHHDTPSHRSGAWQRALQASDLFTPTHELKVPFEQVLTPNQFVDRIASISFIAALPDRDRRAPIEAIRRLAVSSGERIALGYVTEVFVYQRVRNQRRPVA